MTLTNARRTDPVTSKDAGRRAKKLAAQEYVRQTMRVFGPMADHELVEFYADDILAYRYGNFTPQRLRTARHELTGDDKEIEFTGIYRLTDRNRRAQVWQTKEHNA